MRRNRRDLEFDQGPADLCWRASIRDLFGDRLRIVRRPDEPAAEYRARKLAANPDSAPLVSDFEHVGGDVRKTHRLLSSRILIFLVLAPAYLKGEDREALRDLREEFQEFGLKSGKAKKIGANSSVIRWVTEEAGEITL